MHLKRIINKIEFKGPNLIKGLEFEGNRCLGTLEHFIKIYSQLSFDEFFFYDIVASLYDQKFNYSHLNKLSNKFHIPVTYCGGLNSLNDISNCLANGADKVSVNTNFLKNQKFIKESVIQYGSPTIISNLEYYYDGNKVLLLSEYGRTPINIHIEEWIEVLNTSSVGEIHFLDVKCDGLGIGADIDLINKLSKNINIPFIVGCGFGKKEHISDILTSTDASGVSISSMFHYNYKEAIDKSFASYSGPELRQGKEIDSGNVEFLNFGYGGFDDIFVDPISIEDLKNFLISKNIKIRDV